MKSAHSKIVEVANLPVHTIQGGTRNGKTIFFLHGKAFRAETWLDLGTLEAAINNGFSVIAIDLPGFGRTPESAITPDMAISEIIKSEGLDKVILVGPSMGGKICLEYALAHPENVAALVLVGSVGVQENRKHLHHLPQATLILWGENDTISDPANGTLLHDSISGSRLVVFKGSPHPCYLDQPDLWHSTLLDFCAGI